MYHYTFSKLHNFQTRKHPIFKKTPNLQNCSDLEKPQRLWKKYWSFLTLQHVPTPPTCKMFPKKSWFFLSTIGRFEMEENRSVNIFIWCLHSFYRLRAMLRKSLMNPCLTWCESGQRTRCQEQSSGVCKSWPLTSSTKCMSTLGQNQLTLSLRPFKRKLSDHQNHQVLREHPNSNIRVKIGFFDPPSPLYGIWHHCYNITFFTKYDFG